MWRRMKIGALVVPKDSLTFHDQVSGDYPGEILTSLEEVHIPVFLLCPHQTHFYHMQRFPSIIVLFMALKSRWLDLHPLKLTFAYYILYFCQYSLLTNPPLLLTCL